MKHPKAKGSRLEREVARRIRQKGLDKDAKRMPLSGADSILKEDIFTHLPVSIECKNVEKVHLWQWWQKIRDYTNPILCISGNHRPIVAVMDLDYWLNLEKYKQDFYALKKQAHA
jgi:hypothetical protein